VGLASVFFYLVHNRNAYVKLSEEVHSAFSSVSDICLGDKLEKCVYLAACIDESLRMSPPTAISLWREVQKGLNVEGEYIPAGVDVGVSIYAIHHNEDIFPNSFTYKPERWIVNEENTQDAIDRARAGFNPFSLGPRACPARSLALSELKLVVARVVFQFDFRKSVGNEGRIGVGRIGVGGGRDRINELQMRSHLTTSIKGPYLEFRGRSGSAGLKA
jgi:cytochrome P450